MNVHRINLDISLPDDLAIDLWLIQWHTPTPAHYQSMAEPHRSEKASIIEQLTELLRHSAESTPEDRIALVVFPEVSLPRDQRTAIDELLAARKRPTIVVAGFEHLTWADYEALAAEMFDTPQPEEREAGRKAGISVNAAGIWVRDRAGTTKRYLQPKLHPSDGEQPLLHSGENLLVFKSVNQGAHRRLNFCVQICSDFCSSVFVKDLRQAIEDSGPELRGLQLDLLILPQHNEGRDDWQFKQSFDAYFDPSVRGTQTRHGCIVFVNNSAPDRGRSGAYGDSGLCFRYGRWRVSNPPATYWVQQGAEHQAVKVREAGPGVYRFSYKPHCWLGESPGSGQVTPFPGNDALFAAIDANGEGGPTILPASALPAEAHWLTNEWRADMPSFLGELEGNLRHLSDEQRKPICTACGAAHRKSFLQWGRHAADHPDRIRWLLHDSYLSCCRENQDYPPDEPEPYKWPSAVAKAVQQLLRCYSLISLGSGGAAQPHNDRIVHASLDDDVGLFFLWGEGLKFPQAMITTCKSHVSGVSLIRRQVLLVLIDPQGIVNADALREDLRLDEEVVAGLEIAEPEHLKPGGVVTKAPRCRHLNLVGSDNLWEKVHSAEDENDLVRGLETLLSEELANGG